MQRLLLMTVGCIATAFAVAGALLPGLPTTPFLLVALWAFARSSERLMGWIERIPLFREALVEARRFEEKRTIRREVKTFALAMAWGSVLIVGIASSFSKPLLLGGVTAAAVGGTIAMWWFPTEGRTDRRSR